MAILHLGPELAHVPLGIRAVGASCEPTEARRRPCGAEPQHELVVADEDGQPIPGMDPEAPPRLAWQRDLMLGADLCAKRHAMMLSDERCGVNLVQLPDEIDIRSRADYRAGLPGRDCQRDRPYRRRAALVDAVMLP
jgi:hypothetical protein